MSSTPQIAAHAVHRYPSIRSGGLLVTLLGLTTLTAALVAHTEPGPQVMAGLFWPGLVVSIAVQVAFRRRLSYGDRSRGQTRGLVAGMVLLGVGLVGAAAGLHDASPRTLWLVVLLVVGVHFLPMWVTHGWRIVYLGFACTAVALVGLAVPGLPFLYIALFDATAKMITGATMLVERPAAATQSVL